MKFEVQIGDLGTLRVFQREILVKLCIAFHCGKRPVLLPDSMPNAFDCEKDENFFKQIIASFSIQDFRLNRNN